MSKDPAEVLATLSLPARLQAGFHNGTETGALARGRVGAV